MARKLQERYGVAGLNTIRQAPTLLVDECLLDTILGATAATE